MVIGLFSLHLLQTHTQTLKRHAHAMHTYMRLIKDVKHLFKKPFIDSSLGMGKEACISVTSGGEKGKGQMM